MLVRVIRKIEETQGQNIWSRDVGSKLVDFIKERYISITREPMAKPLDDYTRLGMQTAAEAERLGIYKK